MGFSQGEQLPRSSANSSISISTCAIPGLPEGIQVHSRWKRVKLWQFFVVQQPSRMGSTPGSNVTTVLPPWGLQNAKTKERRDKLTSRQFHPTNCHEGNTQGLEVKVRVAERRPIDPKCTSTYRQTNMTELGCPFMSATHSRLSCHVRRSLLCWLSFGVGHPK